jgi:hypothetical protein
MALINKQFLIQVVITKLTREIENLELSLGVTHQTINDAPGAMQSHSDTTRFQATNVVNEQSKTLLIKQQALRDLMFFASTHSYSQSDRVELGCVFSVTDGNEETYFILVPGVGGTEIEYNGVEYQVTTPAAPLPSHAMGKKQGDKIIISQRRTSISFEICKIF